MDKKKTSKGKKIPKATIIRLPVYLHYLTELAQKGISVVPSHDLAELAGGNGPQLRKDLSYLGEFGTRGVGYNVGRLAHHISKFMGLNKEQSVAIIGVGKLGMALINYKGFAEKGFKICAGFDNNSQMIGKKVDDLVIYDVRDLGKIIKEKDIEICIITVPASEAQSIADKLISCGIKAILNFAPIFLKVPDDVVACQIDLSIELQILSFYRTLLK